MKFSVSVGEIMTSAVQTIDMNDTVEKAAKIMKENNIGSVVVMGEKNVKGIITSSDIVNKYVAERKGDLVKDIMSGEIVKISPGKTIEDAARLMVAKKIKKLLGFDKERFVGVITATDILRVEPELLEVLLERMKAGGRRPEGVEFSECEVCGNYSDDVEEVNGMYTCSECRE